MARGAPALLAWMAWMLVFVSWVLMLAGVSALQKNCGAAGTNSILLGGAADYLAPVSCSALFRYTWWIVWYQFAIMILAAVLLAKGVVHTTRYMLIGLLMPITYLLTTTCNTYQVIWNAPAEASGSLSSRAKVMFAGSIIGVIADYALIILVGVHDEKEPPPVALS